MFDYTAGLPYIRECYEKRRNLFSESHPLTVDALFQKGVLLQNEDDLKDALAKRKELLGETHLDTLRAMRELGRFLRNHQRYSEAFTVF